jgi:hypothetical protein
MIFSGNMVEKSLSRSTEEKLGREGIINSIPSSRSPPSLDAQSDNGESHTKFENEVCPFENDDCEQIVSDPLTSCPKGFGGLLTGVNSTNAIPVPASRHNSELFYFCKSSS